MGLGYKLDINYLKKLDKNVAGHHHVNHAINMLENPSNIKSPPIEKPIPTHIPLDNFIKFILMN